MLITAIRRKRGDLYAVYSGGEEVALIDSETLAECERLAVGNELTEEELDDIQAQSNRRQARSKALGIVARKEISRRAIIKKLGESGFSEDACEYAADEMERLGFVNDRRCAEMLAEDIYHLRHFGRRRCAYELQGKGIDKELADEVAAELAPEPQEAIYGLLKGKLARDMDSEAGIKRCMNTLMRYGYEPSDIREAFARLRDEEE